VYAKVKIPSFFPTTKQIQKLEGRSCTHDFAQKSDLLIFRGPIYLHRVVIGFHRNYLLKPFEAMGNDGLLDCTLLMCAFGKDLIVVLETVQ